MESLRIAREELRLIARGGKASHAHLRSRLVVLTIVSVALDVVASVLVLLFEHHAPGTGIHTYGDALFWTSGQLLTVSSNLPNPISTGGRVLDIVLEAYAITAVAFLAGSFGAFFHRRGIERDPVEPGSG